MNFRFICMLPRGISPAFRALFLAQHLNPWRAWPPFLQDLQVVLNMNGLATGRQSHAQTQQRQSANRAAEGFYWMQMWTIKSYRPCVKRGSVTFHSLVCNNSTGILVDFQNWHTSPAKCFRCRKTSQQTYSAREFLFFFSYFYFGWTTNPLSSALTQLRWWTGSVAGFMPALSRMHSGFSPVKWPFPTYQYCMRGCTGTPEHASSHQLVLSTLSPTGCCTGYH